MKGGTRVLLVVTVLVAVLVSLAVWSEMKSKAPAAKAGVEQAKSPDQPKQPKPHSKAPAFGGGTLAG